MVSQTGVRVYVHLGFPLFLRLFLSDPFRQFHHFGVHFLIVFVGERFAAFFRDRCLFKQLFLGGWAERLGSCIVGQCQLVVSGVVVFDVFEHGFANNETDRSTIAGCKVTQPLNYLSPCFRVGIDQ